MGSPRTCSRTPLAQLSGRLGLIRRQPSQLPVSFLTVHSKSPTSQLHHRNDLSQLDKPFLNACLVPDLRYSPGFKGPLDSAVSLDGPELAANRWPEDS